MYVFPWDVRDGYVNLTEKGIVEQPDLNALAFYQRVFDGKRSIIATWEDSTRLNKPLGVNHYEYDFHVGKYYKLTPVAGGISAGVEIDSNNINEDMLAMKDNFEVTFVCYFKESTLLKNNSNVLANGSTLSYGFLPTDKDRFKFYTIPELAGNKWFYISNVEYLPKEMKDGIVAVQITFSTLMDKLQNSGKAVEQYVQYGAIGEPYAKPELEEQEDESYLVTANVVEQEQPRYLQVEFQGLSYYCDTIVYGRRVYKQGDKWISEAPKRLMFDKLITPTINNLNKTSLPSKNFYLFTDTTLSYTFSKEWVQEWKAMDNQIAQNNVAGKISFDNINDWTNLSNGIHKSNPVLETIGSIHYDIFNQDWRPLSSGVVFNSLGCPYCASQLTYWPTDSIVDILNKNAFVFSTQLVLPLSFYSSKPYKISNLPIIGGFIAPLIGDMTMFANTKQRKAINLCGIVDCDCAGMLVNLPTQQGANDPAWTFLGAFNGKEDAPKMLGLNSTNTSLCMKLSDRVKCIDSAGSYREFDTAYFGQTKNEHGEWLNQDHSVLLLNDNPQNRMEVQTVEYGFVIDRVVTQAIFNGDIRITAQGPNQVFEDDQLWATTICSNTKWRGDSYRDWTTEINTGGWGDEYCAKADDFTWPEALVLNRGEFTISSDIQVPSVLNNTSCGPDNSIELKNNTLISGKYDTIEIEGNNTVLSKSHTYTYNLSYSELGLNITTEQEFINFFNKGSIFINCNGGIGETHKDIFYRDYFDLDIPTGSGYEIQLDNNAVCNNTTAILTRQLDNGIWNFNPYEDWYLRLNVYTKVGQELEYSKIFDTRLALEATTTLTHNSQGIELTIVVKDKLYIPDIQAKDQNNMLIFSGGGFRSTEINKFRIYIPSINFFKK